MGYYLLRRRGDRGRELSCSKHAARKDEQLRPAVAPLSAIHAAFVAREPYVQAK